MGRLVLRPGSFALAEAALLTLRLAFDIFQLREVWGTALVENARLISFVESCGFERRGIVAIHLDGTVHDGIKHVLTKDRWRDFEKKVIEIARAIADKFPPDR